MTIPTGQTFFVPGIPAPGGSKKGFVNPKTKRVVIVDDCSRNKDWRASVALAGSQKFSEPLQGPLTVEVVFYMPRPKGHFRANGTLKPSAPRYPTTKPDVLKLTRSTEDALTGIAWADDSQIVSENISKRYGMRPGADIRIMEAE